MISSSVTPEQWREQGTFFEWRGHSIFTRESGDTSGEPLLLIHGFPTSSWDWHEVWPALAQHRRLIAFDMLGFGWSAKPIDADYSIDLQADLAEAVLLKYGITRYRILAHDYGVSVAQELLARQLARAAVATITSITFLNGGLFPETHHPVLTQRLLASPAGPLLAKLIRFSSFSRSMKKIGGTTPPSDEELGYMWQQVMVNDGRARMPALIGYMAERRTKRERWVGAIISSDVPMRVINGLADPVSGAHMVARYRELISNPDVVELAGVGHYPQIEAPEAVSANVL